MLTFRDYLRTNRSSTHHKRRLQKFAGSQTGMYTATIPPDDLEDDLEDDQFGAAGSQAGRGAVKRGSPQNNIDKEAISVGWENQEEDPDQEINTDNLVPEVQPTDDTSYEEEPNPDIEPQDPNRQGLIRTVPDAHLVYKRNADDGTFEELWVYNIGRDFTDGTKIRENILSGTDVQVTKVTSEDGSQQVKLWTTGNVQMMQIRGLPN